MNKRSRISKILAVTLITASFLTGCAGHYIKEGTKLMGEEKYAEAITAFEKSVEKDDNTAEAYRGIGIANYEQQNYKEAAEAFQKVLDNDGEATPVLYNLIGVCAMKQDDIAGAAGAFEQGITLAEKEGSSQDTSDEKEDYSETLQEMRFNQIVCYEKQADWENAKTKMAEYTQDYPDDQKAAREAEFLSTR